MPNFFPRVYYIFYNNNNYEHLYGPNILRKGFSQINVRKKEKNCEIGRKVKVGTSRGKMTCHNGSIMLFYV